MDPAPIPRWLDVAARWSWRLLVVGAAVVALGLTASYLRVVLTPIAAALLLSTLLVPVRRRLSAAGLPNVIAATLTVVGFLAVLGGLLTLIAQPMIDEFEGLGPTLEDARDDFEEWLIEGPPGLDPQTVTDARDRIGEQMRDWVSSDGAVVDAATVAAEAFTGALLTLVVAFFLVKDGERIQAWARSWVPPSSRPVVDAGARAAWETLSGFLRGAAVLGVVEGTILAVALAAVGAELALPVAVLTFVAAFFPFVGAIVSAVVAVAVTLATAGTAPALIVAVVAFVVQQFDNELLAPLIYGRFLHVHPLVVILSLATGVTIAGLTGAFLAVPLTAVVVNTVSAVRVGLAEAAVVAGPDTG